MVWIELTAEEAAFAAEVGRKRQAMQDGVGRRDRKILTASGTSIHQLGCGAELAVAKMFGLKWDGQFFADDAQWLAWRTDGHDMAGLEVRSTPRHDGRLLLHDSDKDRAPYVLVRSHANPRYEIVGWAWGQEGKKQLPANAALELPRILIKA